MKNFLRIVSSLLCIVLTIHSYGQTALKRNLSLKEAVEIAIKNNLLVRQSGLSAEAGRINLQQARANRLPYVDGSINHGIQQGRSIDPFTNQFVNQKINYARYGLNAGLIIFNGLSIHHNVQSALLGQKAAEMELQQEKENLTMNVILAYLQVLTNAELLIQSDNQLRLIKKQVERLHILHESGAINPSELFDLKGQLAGDELASVNNQNALDISLLTLTQLLNIPYDGQIQLEKPSIEDFNLHYTANADQVYLAALEELAMVKAAMLQKQSAERNLKSVKGERFPILSLDGNITTNYSSAAYRDILLGVTERATDNYVTVNGTKMPVFSPVKSFNSEKIAYREQLDNNLFTSINLGLRIPVFNRFQTRTRIRLAEITEKNIGYLEEYTRIQLRQNIEQACFNLEAAKKRYQTLLTQVEAFSESFRTVEERFNAGVLNSVDYLVARNNLDRANINLISARYDYLLKTKLIDFYRGNTDLVLE